MSNTFEKGRILGRYELLLPLARGGMAEVWAARLHGTRGFQKLVAIKTMLPGVIEDERAELMFMEEAGLACQIQHPNVVETMELGEEDGVLYLVMEWIDGEPLNYLQKSLNGKRMPLDVAVNLIGQCCKGLHAAHELKDEQGELLGVVHRDISPHNILVSYNGIAKIVDFGIAKVTSQNVGLTEAGEIKGKLAYMSPEHLSGRPVDRRSDLFALGVVLYQLTTGQHPFRGETPGETVRNTTVKEPAPPSSLVEEYPAALERIVLKALEKLPARRYATARELLLDLQKAVPSALGHGADADTAVFLRGLLGDRIRTKKAAIKQAVEASQFNANTGLLQVTASANSGTMGAVISESTGSNEQLTELLLASKAAARRHAFLGAAGAIGLAGLIAVATSQFRSDPQAASVAIPEPPLAAAAAAVSAVPMPSAPSPQATVASADPSAESKPAAAESDQEMSEPEEQKNRRGKKRKPRGVPRKVIAVPDVEPEPKMDKPPAVLPSAPSSKPSDRSELGGRW